MDKSKVFFTNLHTTPSSNLLDKMERLIKRAGIESIDFKDQFVAIKIHFGEPGNLAYLRPNYAARLATLLRSWGAKPFLTDCNTLYSGRRANAVDHLQSAMENGYNPISAQCQVIIADGLKGTEYREIPLNGEYCKAPKIGSALADADIVISMTHFKGHEQAGFGGALKNLGMGGASVGGKLELDTSERLNYKIAEYTQAILKDKPHFHISFIMNVSPECDCWNHNDAAIIPDLGILASFDPVALDKACADMVIAAPAINGSCLTEKHPHEHLEGADKFHLMHPDTNWQAGLEHAQKIGLGVMQYELITV